MITISETGTCSLFLHSYSVVVLQITGVLPLRVENLDHSLLQKGGVPAAPSGTATLLRLSPSYQFYPRPLLAVADFRYPQLPWLDGRCVQGPGTYSPRHG